MASYIRLFTSFSGRINRARWWLGTIVLAIVSVGGSMILDPSILDLEREFSAIPKWRDTLLQLALVIPGTALTVKRFNDRDWPYWLGFVFGALGMFTTLAPQFGWLIPGRHMSIPEIAVIVILLPAFLFAFIDNGFLIGTDGPNRYGRDPPATAEPML